MNAKEIDFDIPVEKSGWIPKIYYLFIGFMLGWGVCYGYHNLGEWASLKDSPQEKSNSLSK